MKATHKSCGAIGLYYDYMRWYDPATGRFISPDPRSGKLSLPQSFNLYIYVLNLPTSLTDPTGMCGYWDIACKAGELSNSAVNWWNSQDQDTKIAIILVVATVAIVATAGLAAPAVLPTIVTGIALGASTNVLAYEVKTIATGGQLTAKGFFTSAATGAFIGAATAGAGEWISAARGATSVAGEGSGLQYSDYFIKSDHIHDIAGKVMSDGLDFQSAENLIGNTLSTGQLTEVGGSFQTYEQVFGTLKEEPMGLRVIWDTFEGVVRNAYPFPV